ncbi:hypothetical protein [Zoogloea dura]|uniref:Uncharacterized protein n=1 Tax=Zoogloea dura TaxID=2728840 RepID=A0A848G586_9RHOO|nr:hypothetical protein [Zoogloea dura]NML26352.1 hypothetical protein [Zoogloea dura]
MSFSANSVEPLSLWKGCITNAVEWLLASAAHFNIEVHHLDPQDLLSNEFVVCWDTELASLLIAHPDAAKFPEALVQIRSQTLQGMSWQEASQFIGERLMLLMPELRARYLDPSIDMLRGAA